MLIITLIDQTTVGINDINKNEVRVYPNPSKGTFEINTFTEEKYTLQITNAIGQTIQTTSLQKGKTTFDLSHEKEGIYFYYLLMGDKIVKTDKIVIIK